MNLSVLINMKGYSISGFAEKVGISADRIQTIINTGKTNVGEFFNMATALDMSCDDLYKYLRQENPGKIINLADYQKGRGIL